MMVALDTCLQNLRYVSKDMPVESRDLNLRVDCLRALRDALKTKATELGCPSERVDPLVDQLDSILATIRYVMSGDILLPEDHNRIVDALRKARDILAEIESWCTGIKDELDRCRTDLEKCQFELSKYLERMRVCTCEVVDYVVHYVGLAKTPDLLLDVWEFRGLIPPHVHITVLYYELLAKVADVARDIISYDGIAKSADVVLDKPLVEVEAKAATASNDI